MTSIELIFIERGFYERLYQVFKPTINGAKFVTGRLLVQIKLANQLSFEILELESALLNYTTRLSLENTYHG